VSISPARWPSTVSVDTVPNQPATQTGGSEWLLPDDSTASDRANTGDESSYETDTESEPDGVGRAAMVESVGVGVEIR